MSLFVNQVGETNHGEYPWLQLDMGNYYDIVEVFFETYDDTTAESFKIRAGNLTVPADERVNATITVNHDCGSVDGTSTRAACCGHVIGRYVTIQVRFSALIGQIS